MEGLIALYTQLTGESPVCQKLKGEGSNRKYYRLISDAGSMVGVVGESVAENHAFISLARHFEEKGLNTPRVMAVSDDEMRYLQEDLGDMSLFSFIKEDIETQNFSEESVEMLCQTIRKLPDVQFKGAENLDFSLCYPLPVMDRQSVLWDLNYFKYCFLKLTKIDFSEVKLETDFQRLTGDLLKYEDNTFLYRDFQSRNVMLKEGIPYFIDFQGGRRGPIYYDVASFVWQAKANYPKALKQKLIETYIDSLWRYQYVDEKSFYEALHLFVFFRMIQVLGAYGYRGLFERKEHFLESIPFAMKNVRDLLNGCSFEAYPYLVSLMQRLSEDDRFQLQQLLDKSKLTVRVYSFSYKKGIPEDVSGNGGGYVFDCRGVHNPGRYEEYKQLTGMDKPVIDFLEKDGEILSFLQNIYELADAHVLRYMERGFSSLMFSCGCTGGQHRSVYSAQHLAEHIARKFGVRVELCHREQNNVQKFNF